MFYTGQSYRQGQVSIAPPELMRLSSLQADPDVSDSLAHWVLEAQRREDILYFSIYLDQETIGQILLHDLDLHTSESLVAYHLFWQHLRGQGIGTQALRLLQTYGVHPTTLRKLIMITSRDNLASQRIAQKCEFQFMRSSREDPLYGMVFEWQVH